MRTAGKEGPTVISPSEATDPAISVRELHTLEDYRACVGLQMEVWGKTFSDAVPASLLKVGGEVGGVAAGAFTENETLVGFVFGLSGVREGRLSHWSHMLGVARPFRGLGIGLRLKTFQRDRLLARGIGEMRWTFDPLVAANAHFNLTVLGAGIERYVPDMYGDMGSDLHALGTDRVIAYWDLRASVETPPGAVDSQPDPTSAAPLRIEIPEHIHDLAQRDPASARAWRLQTREAFLSALQSGYEVHAFSRDAGEGLCEYQLRRSAG